MGIWVFNRRYFKGLACPAFCVAFCVALLLSTSCGGNADASDVGDGGPADVGPGDDADAGGNQPPNGVIDLPAGDVTITAGDSVEFLGTGTEPDGDLPLSYLWSFGSGSGIPDSTDEDPGLLQFDNPGEYVVSFTVTDSRGLSDPTPDTNDDNGAAALRHLCRHQRTRQLHLRSHIEPLLPNQICRRAESGR